MIVRFFTLNVLILIILVDGASLAILQSPKSYTVRRFDIDVANPRSLNGDKKKASPETPAVDTSRIYKEFYANSSPDIMRRLNRSDMMDKVKSLIHGIKSRVDELKDAFEGRIELVRTVTEKNIGSLIKTMNEQTASLKSSTRR